MLQSFAQLVAGRLRASRASNVTVQIAVAFIRSGKMPEAK
jgi:hypothetical protein